MKSRLILLGLGVVAGLALAGTGLGWFARPYTFHGSLIESSVAAPDFTLTDQQERPFQLSAQAGNVVLLFFGYTSCPDVCPATLAEFKQVRAELGPQAARVRLVMVTTDPQVDNAGQLARFLGGIDPAIIGLTGTQSELTPVWGDYGVYVEKAGPGAVDHTPRIYAIDSQGNLRLTYTTDTPAADIVEDVRQLLKGLG